MKCILNCFTLVVLLFSSINVVNAQTINPNYDAKLAEKLGADDYGMKTFVCVILKSGTNESEDETLKNEAFSGHIANINRLVKENKLIIAGPFGQNNADFRGLLILNVSTIDEAKKLLETDPAIKAKYLAPELFSWYGSAALAEYLDASDRIWKIKP